ncbi:hypothetical protein LPJ66_000808 [Kickxella alabastrina]|uniref:Uncharacterized protein n=1 Tax=Kickxella alabastrina TaxID=61397 RepID=A0ACC1IV53_9FUNG|nr:hypothetical protein LPJ66_000808 [Kickxella alabastrina]
MSSSAITSAASTASAKKQLRTHLRSTLSLIPLHSLQAQSHLVTRHLLQHPLYQRSQHISIYISTASSELQTTELLRHALSTGKAVYVPRCHGPKQMDMCRVQDLDDLAGLQVNQWGIAEPGMEREPVDPSLLDFVVVPGLAFDRSGQRCGHGRGYYDRFLENLDAVTCAVALSEQIVDQVPVDAFDRTPDLIIAPEGVIYSSGSRV